MRISNRMTVAIRFLIPLNVVLLAAILAFTPEPAQATARGAIFDCCKVSTWGVGFCCDNCCWFTSDCDFSSECGFN